MYQNTTTIIKSFFFTEYVDTLQVNEKIDIYSYGVVLMEILSGKRVTDQEFDEEEHIVDWVKSKMKGKDGIDGVLYKNEGAECSSTREEMAQMLRIALLCTSRNPADRPSMRKVVSMLEGVKSKGKLPDIFSFVVGEGSANKYFDTWIGVTKTRIQAVNTF